MPFGSLFVDAAFMKKKQVTKRGSAAVVIRAGVVRSRFCKCYFEVPSLVSCGLFWRS